MTDYDVLVVGGGAAGLSAALVLGRARRRVLVVDAGEPRNAPADGVHGYLTSEGMPPGELVEVGRAEVRSYGGEVVDGRVVAIEPGRATLADGTTVRARAVIVTTGLVDELPDVDGLRERWGRDVLHCPYCHGHEVADTAIGVLGGVHKALLVRQWSSDLTLFLDGGPDPTEEQWAQLAARGISVVDGLVAGVVVEDDRLVGVRLADGTVVARTALFVSPFFRATGDLLTALGVETVDLEFEGTPVASHVVAGPTGRTSVPGVWVAGNVTDPMAQVVMAAAAGVRAAADVNGYLILDDTERAVRGREAAALERRVSEIVLGDRRHGLSLTPAPSSSTT